MYWCMSPSITASARLYARLPVPPGTSASGTPPSSLYWCQRSSSSSSAAARNWRIATSPSVRPAVAKAAGGSAKSRVPAIAPAPTAAPLSTKERRVVKCPDWSVLSILSPVEFGGQGAWALHGWLDQPNDPVGAIRHNIVFRLRDSHGQWAAIQGAATDAAARPHRSLSIDRVWSGAGDNRAAIFGTNAPACTPRS